jgi:hypothetical protein
MTGHRQAQEPIYYQPGLHDKETASRDQWLSARAIRHNRHPNDKDQNTASPLREGRRFGTIQDFPQPHLDAAILREKWALPCNPYKEFGYGIGQST